MSAAVSHFITREGTGALQLLGLAAQLAASRRAARSACSEPAARLARSRQVGRRGRRTQTARRQAKGAGRDATRHADLARILTWRSDTGDTMGRAIEFRRRRLQSCAGSGQQGEQASRASREQWRALSSQMSHFGRCGQPTAPWLRQLRQVAGASSKRRSAATGPRASREDPLQARHLRPGASARSHRTLQVYGPRRIPGAQAPRLQAWQRSRAAQRPGTYVPGCSSKSADNGPARYWCERLAGASWLRALGRLQM